LCGVVFSCDTSFFPIGPRSSYMIHKFFFSAHFPSFFFSFIFFFFFPPPPSLRSNFRPTIFMPLGPISVFNSMRKNTHDYEAAYVLVPILSNKVTPPPFIFFFFGKTLGGVSPSSGADYAILFSRQSMTPLALAAFFRGFFFSSFDCSLPDVYRIRTHASPLPSCLPSVDLLAFLTSVPFPTGWGVFPCSASLIVLFFSILLSVLCAPLLRCQKRLLIILDLHVDVRYCDFSRIAFFPTFFIFSFSFFAVSVFSLTCPPTHPV